MTVANKTAIAVAVMAAGVLVISAADAAGRSGADGSVHSAAVAAYWLGEALIFAPPTALVLSGATLGRAILGRASLGRASLGRTSLGEAAGAWLAVALAVATYLVKFLYSPAFFAFPDELEHARTLSTLLATHHLFGVNYALPVSPDYPGIEVATSALMAVTGLSVFAAGLIIAGVAHVVLTVALYSLFRSVGGTARIGLAAVTIYATSPHYQVFDAIFGYQTLALAFFALALLALRRATRPDAGQPDGTDGGGTDGDGARLTRVAVAWVLAAVFAAATAVTHHITSYVLAAIAVLIAAATLIARPPATTDLRAVTVRSWRGRAAAAPAAFGLGCAAAIALWTWRIAPGVPGYLSPAFSQLADGVKSALGGHLSKSAGGAPLPAPLGDRAASDLVALMIVIAIPFGWWRIWHTQRGDAWALALGAGAAAYYPCVVLPFISVDGSELAGRVLTFVYIPVGYTLAVALLSRPPIRNSPARGRPALTWRIWRWRPRNWRTWGWRATGVGGAALLLAGGISMGWPPWWERLPGGYVVDGFESGITAESVAAANWAAATLPPGQRTAADYTNNLLFGTLGGQNPVNGMAALFCGGRWTASDALLARQQAVRYLVVDLRLSTSRQPDGNNFVGTATGCTTPVPAADLAKFTTTRGLTRIYDSGNIIVYALGEAAYVP
jgi:hypothetical protein